MDLIPQEKTPSKIKKGSAPPPQNLSWEEKKHPVSGDPGLAAKLRRKDAGAMTDRSTTPPPHPTQAKVQKCSVTFPSQSCARPDTRGQS